MNSIVIIVGCVLMIAWAIETWNYRRARRYREQREQREREGLRHVVGSGRKWWSNPPEEEDDLGDH